MTSRQATKCVSSAWLHLLEAVPTACSNKSWTSLQRTKHFLYFIFPFPLSISSSFSLSPPLSLPSLLSLFYLSTNFPFLRHQTDEHHPHAHTPIFFLSAHIHTTLFLFPSLLHIHTILLFCTHTQTHTMPCA